MKYILRITCILVGVVASMFTSARETGSWAEVSYVYVTSAENTRPYVTFRGSPMPGCYNDNGGYLSGDKAYSAILAAHLAGRQVRPLYEIVGDDPNRWSVCNITSIYVR